MSIPERILTLSASNAVMQQKIYLAVITSLEISEYYKFVFLELECSYLPESRSDNFNDALDIFRTSERRRSLTMLRIILLEHFQIKILASGLYYCRSRCKYSIKSGFHAFILALCSYILSLIHKILSLSNVVLSLKTGL